MYASIIRLDFEECVSTRERGRWCRSLASALDAIQGFVAVIALEADHRAVAVLCVCMDAEALDEARQVAATWEHDRDGRQESAMRPLIAGEVIFQRGF